MSQSEAPLSNEDTLELLLDEWEEAIERGEDPDAETICQQHPQLLAQFIAKTNVLAELNGKLNKNEIDNSATAPMSSKMPEPMPASAIDWRAHVGQLEYHAHGGLGIVFRGFDEKLHRDVAIKFIRERRRSNPLDVQRFRVEAEITSRLDHPGVVPVHGYGISESGVPFYAMRMVEGQTLQERIDEYHKHLRREAAPSDSSLEFRKLLSSFVSVCNTIEYAHTRGVINCDIKPGNIMLGKFGETVVLDWGCAKYVGRTEEAKKAGEDSLKPLSDTAGSEPTGMTGGTPIYMSPEQHAQAEEIGPSSDIYSLGVTLFRIITGLPAFSPDSTLPKIRESVLRGKFRKPTDICPWLSKALEAVCMKAMELDPEARYDSAAELARDLERYLADEEVTAYVEPFSRRVARLMRRHRGVSQVLFFSVVSLILVSSIFAVVMGQSAASESYARQQAIENRNRSLQMAARYAATSMALKINDAWRVLEKESSSGFLKAELNRLQGVDDQSEWESVQQWLLKQADANQQATQAASWFLCDANGTQIARSPLFDPTANEMYDSIGENFSHRDYFQGDADNATTSGLPAHIEQVHISAVYQSSNTSNLKVAFSIPIWSETEPQQPRQFLGVLGYSVELGQFALLQDQQESELLQQIAVLVDLRQSKRGDGQDFYGVVLQHQQMPDILDDLEEDLSKLPKLEASTLATVEQYRKDRVDQIREYGFKAPSSDVLLLEDYRDPLGMVAAGSIVAAFEPVCVVGRPDGVFDTGWLIVIEEFESERMSSPVSEIDRRQ